MKTVSRRVVAGDWRALIREYGSGRQVRALLGVTAGFRAAAPGVAAPPRLIEPGLVDLGDPPRDQVLVRGGVGRGASWTSSGAAAVSRRGSRRARRSASFAPSQQYQAAVARPTGSERESATASIAGDDRDYEARCRRGSLAQLDVGGLDQCPSGERDILETIVRAKIVDLRAECRRLAGLAVW